MNATYQRPQHEHVSQAMTTNLLTVTRDRSLVDAAHMMAERRVGAILVTEEGALIGILTERDVLRAVGANRIDGSVSDWMTLDPITVGSTATIGEAAMMMVHGGFRHVPIVDDGKLVGIVSIRDLLRLPNETPAGV